MVKKFKKFFEWSLKEQNEWIWEIAIAALGISFGVYAVFVL